MLWLAVPKPTTTRTEVDVGKEGPQVASVATPLALGVTHSRYSADDWNNPTAVSNARSVLRRSATFQNQHLMGWGADNPEPSPGVYNWHSLDHRVDLIRRSGGVPILTLAGAPDWMTGGKAGETDWSENLTRAPLPKYVDDFATLSAKAATRYPQIRYFQVWNELKGMYNPLRNRWDAERYTDLYNAVYRAVKAVRPDALIGGPYVVVDSWRPGNASHPSDLFGGWGVADRRALEVIEYWLSNHRGADFLAVDADTVTKSGELVADEFSATEKFADVARWVRSRTNLPIVWAEWGVQPRSATWPLRRQNAVMTTAVARMAMSGASIALLWGPQQNDGICRGCLWTDTQKRGGGESTPFAKSMASWRLAFPPGTQIREIGLEDASVLAIASDRTLLVVNQSDRTREVAVGRLVVPLGGYEVRYVGLQRNEDEPDSAPQSPPRLPRR